MTGGVWHDCGPLTGTERRRCCCVARPRRRDRSHAASGRGQELRRVDRAGGRPRPQRRRQASRVGEQGVHRILTSGEPRGRRTRRSSMALLQPHRGGANRQRASRTTTRWRSSKLTSSRTRRSPDARRRAVPALATLLETDTRNRSTDRRVEPRRAADHQRLPPPESTSSSARIERSGGSAQPVSAVLAQQMRGLARPAGSQIGGVRADRGDRQSGGELGEPRSSARSGARRQLGQKIHALTFTFDDCLKLDTRAAYRPC